MPFDFQHRFSTTVSRAHANSGIADAPDIGELEPALLRARLLGRLGEVHVDSSDLLRLGIASLIGILCVVLVGWWTSVSWDPVQFVRQLPWLAFDQAWR